jgi:hypothetical protein
MWPFKVWSQACGTSDVRALLLHPAVLLQQLMKVEHGQRSSAIVLLLVAVQHLLLPLPQLQLIQLWCE